MDIDSPVSFGYTVKTTAFSSFSIKTDGYTPITITLLPDHYGDFEIKFVPAELPF